MEPFAIRPVTGGTLDPGDVVGRDDLIVHALQQLRAGVDLVINDPRRMGKTALLDRLCNEPGASTIAIKIDYEGVASAEDFVLRTIRAIHSNASTWKRLGDTISVFVDGIDASKGPLTIKASFKHRPPHEFLIDLIARIDAKFADSLLVIAMDEVTIGIANIAKNEGAAAADQLMQALRRARQASGSIRWIVTGSIGFHHVIRRAESTEGVINDLTELPVGPLSDADAAFLASCLMLGIGRKPATGALAALVERSGGIPFIIQHLAKHLEGGSGDATIDEVHQAFDSFLNDRDASRPMTHLLTRIDTYWGNDSKIVNSVLDTIAISNGLATASLKQDVDDDRLDDRDEFLRIMNGLVDDHYLVHDEGGRWRWRYDVLRRVWVGRRKLEQ